MKIPKSHSDIIEKKARAILSTVDENSKIYSGFCFIQCKENLIFLDSIEDEQIEHILLNDKVSILTIDPANVDRWFCIQGTISPNNMKESNIVNIKKVFLFPKER